MTVTQQYNVALFRSLYLVSAPQLSCLKMRSPSHSIYGKLNEDAVSEQLEGKQGKNTLV